MDEKVREIDGEEEELCLWNTVKSMHERISALESELYLRNQLIADLQKQIAEGKLFLHNVHSKIKEKDKELEDALHLRDIHQESAQYFEKKLEDANIATDLAEARIKELREGIEKFRREMQSPVHLGNRSRALAELYKLIEGDKP